MIPTFSDNKAKDYFKDFCRKIEVLKVAIPTFSPDFTQPKTLIVWFDAFKETSPEALWGAFAKARATLDTFPSIATLLRFCAENNGTLAENPFEQILKICSNHKNIPAGTHKALLETIACLGGAEVISEWNQDVFHFKRKEVEAIFKSVADKILIGQPLMLETSFDAVEFIGAAVKLGTAPKINHSAPKPNGEAMKTFEAKMASKFKFFDFSSK